MARILKRAIKNCLNCKNDFKIEVWRLKEKRRGIFCSKECYWKYYSGERSPYWGRSLKGSASPSWRGGKPNCIDCGKQVSLRKYKRCQSCRLNFYKGELAPHWKGGIKRPHLMTSDKLERMRFRLEIQKLIFERDEYKCQICGLGGNLQVDHISSWAEFKELRFDPDNCRTLCAKCHYKLTFKREMPENTKGWGHNLLKGGY